MPGFPLPENFKAGDGLGALKAEDLSTAFHALNSLATGGHQNISVDVAPDGTLALIVPEEDVLPVGTIGEVIYHDGTQWVTLAAGTNGYVLRSNAGAAPTWQAAGSGTVTPTGTPADEEISVWTAGTVIEGRLLETILNSTTHIVAEEGSPSTDQIANPSVGLPKYLRKITAGGPGIGVWELEDLIDNTYSDGDVVKIDASSGIRLYSAGYAADDVVNVASPAHGDLVAWDSTPGAWVVVATPSDSAHSMLYWDHTADSGAGAWDLLATTGSNYEVLQLDADNGKPEFDYLRAH